MSEKTQLDAFGVVVADMAKALAFYRELGLDIPADADAQPHVEVELSGGIRLMFDPVETIHAFDPGWTPPEGGPGMGLAFRCADASAVDATHARLVSLGYESHKEPWDAFWGQRYAILRDPDGNDVSLYAPLAESE